MEKKFDLEERLIEFAAQIIQFTESMISEAEQVLLWIMGKPRAGNLEKILYISLKSF